MPDPHILAIVRKVPCHVKNILVVPSGQLFMFFPVNLLDIQNEQICYIHQLLKF